jgi:hypothetical protein
MADILSGRPERQAIVEEVGRESQFVFRDGNDPNRRIRETVYWDDFISSGLLTLVDDPSEAEAQTFVDLSVVLDDGEAMTGAIAIHRGYGVITDDRKASRILSGLGIVITSSLDLVAEWIEESRIPSEQAATVLLDIRIRARYVPPRTHGRYEWWVSTMHDPG